jgi:hypothetical protein
MRKANAIIVYKLHALSQAFHVVSFRSAMQREQRSQRNEAMIFVIVHTVTVIGIQQICQVAQIEKLFDSRFKQML